MLAYQMFGNKQKPNKKTDHFVGDWYVKFSKELETNESLEEEAQRMLKKWEEGDKETIELWKKMNKWAIDGMGETYARLGLKHERTYYESDFYTKGKDIIEEGFKKGIFEKDDGAIMVNLEKQNLPNKILIRSDGTSIYMTQDIYLAEQKITDFKADRSLYVVGSEQELHFKQLFSILNILGHKWADKCHHLSYGMVNLTTGKMKSREGTVVDADDLMDEVENLAKKEILRRHKELSKKELDKRAHIIGIGALRFYLLKMDLVKDMLYDPKESVDFEGETGPYVQYAHARICSILRKTKAPSKYDVSALGKEEHMLVKMIGSFPSVVEDAAKHYKPSIICRYLLDLAQELNSYYHSVPVLKASSNKRDARLVLLEGTKRVIALGLELLQIEAPEEM